MKAIFTYPSDLYTSYIDPLYVGDATTGFYKRIQDLKDGSYISWNGTAPVDSVNEIMSEISKFYKYYDDRGDANVTQYDFTTSPLVVLTIDEAVTHITGVTSGAGSLVSIALSNNYDSDISTGDDYYLREFKVTSGLNVNSLILYSSFPRNFAATGTVANSVLKIPDTVNIGWTNLGGQSPRFIRSGNGAIVKMTNPLQVPNPLVKIYKSEPFSEAHDTGTLDTTAPIYMSDEWGSDYTRFLYLDEAKTIPATISEVYYTSTFTRNFTATAGTTNYQQIQNWSLTNMSTADQQELKNDFNGWCRLTFTNFTGSGASFNPQVGSTEPITATINYDYLFYYEVTGTVGVNLKVTISDQRGGPGVPADFNLNAGAGGSASVDINVEFINPARMTATDRYKYKYDGTETLTGKLINAANWNVAAQDAYFKVLDGKVVIPSNAVFSYQNSSNVTQYAAEFSNNLYLAGETRQDYDTWSNIITPFTASISVDSNGIPDGTITITDGGLYNNYVYGEAMVLALQSPADQYVPPAPTPEQTAAAEDVFDTADQWTNAQGFNGQKEFGKNIIPTTASITYVQPSTTNMSQNGRKYVRSSGFVKTKLEVNYTNLTSAEFQELHADAQAARGQAAMFYLITRNWGRKVLNFNNAKSTGQPRLVEPVVAGETIMKFGGFMSNESEVFKKGEMIIGGGGSNGGLLTVLNTVDANVYGEAKIRVAYGNPSYQQNGNIAYKDPYHIIVSLDSDEFQYTVDTFGKYNVTVTFESGSFS